MQGPEAIESPRTARTPAGAFPILGIAIAIAMLASAGFLLLEDRRDTWRAAERAGANLVATLDRDLARNIRALDLSLHRATHALADPAFAQASPEVRAMALFDQALTADPMGVVIVADAQGTILTRSDGPGLDEISLATRDFFRAHSENPAADTGLYVSHPYRSQSRGGIPTLALSRRIPAPDGSFAGIVAAGLNLAYLEDTLAQLDLGPEGSVFLLHTDGPLLARHPVRQEEIGRDFNASRVARQIATGGPEGRFIATSAIDGEERLYTYRRIEDLPLAVAVSLPTSEIEAPWWRKLRRLGTLTASLCTALILLSLAFRREMMKRQATERALRAAAAELAALTTTDELTGLPNQARFAEALARESRRAARTGRPIALLRLAVDAFPGFAERHGRAAADDALRRIGETLRRATRQPGDLAARGAKENFALLLPETDAAAARQLAHALRAAAEALAIPDATSPLGYLTISIGWAAAHLTPEDPPHSLEDAAEAALRRAQSVGGNTVAEAEPLTPPGKAGPPAPADTALSP